MPRFKDIYGSFSDCKRCRFDRPGQLLLVRQKRKIFVMIHFFNCFVNLEDNRVVLQCSIQSSASVQVT